MGMSLKGNPTRAILCLGVASRVLVACLFVLWRNVADSYDTSAELNPPCLSNTSFWASLEAQTQPTWGQSLGKALERTIVWDSVHYVRIAECGYEYEQTHAFLPALPLLMRFLSRTIFYNLIQALGRRPTLALSGYVINNIAFILAAYFLYRLSKQVLEDENQAIQAVALFCFNPASSFYSGIYSESLFALFSFAGLWHFLKGARWTAIAIFCLSSVVRSNGILHAGFFLFQAMHKAYEVAFCQRRLTVTALSLAVVPLILLALLQCTAVIAPFVAFQYYGFTQLCLQEGMTEIRPWCKATVPYLYGFVQSYYWNVGFFHYYQMKQLPNFLLGSPMLSLALCAIVTYAKHQPRLFFLLGLAASPSTRAKVALMPLKDSKAVITSSGQDLKEMVVTEQASDSLHDTGDDTEKLRKRKGSKPNIENPDLEAEPLKEMGFNSPGSICFLIQLCFMLGTAAFVMHVQVATRFLSVSPPIYWYGAYLLNHAAKRKFGYLMWTVFLSYITVGSLLFINFYPFT